MRDVQGSETVNDTFVKTMHAGTKDRDFTVQPFHLLITWYVLKKVTVIQMENNGIFMEQEGSSLSSKKSSF
jgi:hypothetical protein